MEDVNVEINIHSSIKISEGGKAFYFDPFKISKKTSDADYIFITHDHYDHLDPDSIKNVMNEKTLFICPCGIGEKIINDCRVNADKVVELKPFDKKELEKSIIIEALPAYNINKNFHKREFNWLSYVLSAGEKRFYVAGDTDITEEAKNVKCDVALVPIGGTYTMDYKEAAELVNVIRPKAAIPTHYGSVVGDVSFGEKFKHLVNSSVDVKIII